MSDNSTIRYSIDDYLKDKKASSPLGKETTYKRGGSAYASPAVAVSTPAVSSPRTLPPAGRQGPTRVTPAEGNTTTFSFDLSALRSESPTLSVVDTTKLRLAEARSRVYDVLNRRFSYDATQSPLYSILMQQYEREAALAAGNAYARAVANTGGYGSSYASLVAENARRRVMEGVKSREKDLFETAKEAARTEREEALETYKQAKALYDDAVEMADYERLLQAALNPSGQ